jgi:hypothetical protein
MVEIESFSSIYGKRLEEAGRNGDLPDNLAIEVSYMSFASFPRMFSWVCYVRDGTCCL